MLRKICAVFLLAVLILAWLPGEPLAAAGADDPAVSRDERLVVGRVSGDLKSSFPKMEKFGTYLAEKLGSQGIRAFEVVVARNNAEMIRLLRQGAVDVVSETPMSAILFAEQAGAEIVLREWKKSRGAYRTVFFSRADSGIRALSDLKDKVIAFEDAGSTTGFLLPLAIIRDSGLDLVALGPGVDRPPPGKVGYRFAKSEVSIAAWVERGVADAGAFSNLDWEDLERSPPLIREKLAVFHESPPIVRSLILVRQGLAPAVKSALTRTLVAIDKDPTGRDALKEYYGVSKYDPLEGDAAAMMRSAEAAYSRVRDEVAP